VTIRVVGLGPAGPELFTAATVELLARTPPSQVYLRTRRHPGAPAVAADHDFDAVYERCATFDEVYAEIVSTLLDAARTAEVVYAVPGSPAVAERTVESLRTEAASVGIEVVVHPALSFLDLAWARLGIDPFAQPVTICDAYRITDDLRGARGPFLIGQTHSRELLSDVKLALSELVADPGRVTVLQRLGLPDERISTVEWFELDHVDDADHLTSVYVPALATTAGWSMAGLERVMATLRERCPWDAEPPSSPPSPPSSPTRVRSKPRSMPRSMPIGTSSATCCSRPCSMRALRRKRAGSRWPM
jgi:tetrapyrrole methylase family protein / MazG family protein